MWQDNSWGITLYYPSLYVFFFLFSVSSWLQHPGLPRLRESWLWESWSWLFGVPLGPQKKKRGALRQWPWKIDNQGVLPFVTPGKRGEIQGSARWRVGQTNLRGERLWYALRKAFTGHRDSHSSAECYVQKSLWSGGSIRAGMKGLLIVTSITVNLKT